MNKETTNRARKLRRTQTKSESLLWNVLRAKQMCNLKFRRQHPIGPFFADFACVAKKLVIEIDGGYHDLVAESDMSRQAFLENEGWNVIRFADEDIVHDVDVVVQAIAAQLGLRYEYKNRSQAGSGMNANRKR